MHVLYARSAISSFESDFKLLSPVSALNRHAVVGVAQYTLFCRYDVLKAYMPNHDAQMASPSSSCVLTYSSNSKYRYELE